MRQKSDLISEHLNLASLDKERRKALEVAKKRACVWMGQVLLHVFPKIAKNGIEVIAGLGHRDDVELGITVPCLAAHCEVFRPDRLKLMKTTRKDIDDAPTHRDNKMAPEGNG